MLEVFFSAPAAGMFKARGLDQGNPICCIELDMDIGRLDEDIESDYRRDLYTQLFQRAYPETLGEERMDDYYDRSLQGVALVENAVRSKEDIRLWLSRNPDNMCHYHYLVHRFLKQLQDVNVYVVEVPAVSWEGTENETCTSYAEWHCMNLYSARELETMTRRVPYVELMYYAERWARLVKENAPLRACINGVLTSVGETFYDDIIISYLRGEQLTESELIGRFMGESNLGLNHNLVVWRVEEMIESGRIEVVSGSETEKKVLREVRLGHI